MPIGRPNACRSCKHLERTNTWAAFCEAYPYGIPREILHGDEGHEELLGDETFPFKFEMADIEGSQELYEAYLRVRTGGQG